MKTRILLLVCLAVTLAGIAATTPSRDWNALGKVWWSHSSFWPTTPGGPWHWDPGFEKAADYMAEQFRAAGLEPAGVDGYRQPMDFHVLEIDEFAALSIWCDREKSTGQIGRRCHSGRSSHAAGEVEAGQCLSATGLRSPSPTTMIWRPRMLRAKLWSW